MSSVIQKKIRSYLSIRNDLHKLYSAIHETQVGSDLRQSLKDLYEFDQLCYSYYALKSYYDLSKSRWDLDYRNLLDDLASLNGRIEDKIPLFELYAEFPELQVLRRQLKENAKEGGKVAYLIVSLSTDIVALKRFLTDAESSSKTEPTKTDKPKDAPNNTTAKLTASVQSKEPLLKEPEKKEPEIKAPVARASETKSAESKVAQTDQILNKPLPNAGNADYMGIIQTQMASGATTIPPTNPEIPHEVPSSRKGPDQINSTTIPQTNAQLARVTSAQLQKINPPQSPHTAEFGFKRASGSQSPNGKRKPTDDSFSQFTTWTREHDVCIFKAALHSPYVATTAIQVAIKRDFGVIISPEAAETLRLHYGMTERTKDKYQYYIQAFHLVASQYHDNRQYVTVPWAEIRMQFARKTDMTLEDWEVKGRYLLFLLHRAVYGSSGEPPSNYSDLADEYRKITVFRGQSSLLGEQESPSSNKLPPRLEFSREKPTIAVDVEEEIWTARMLALLVAAHVKIPLGTPNRLLSIKHYILLESGKDIDVKEVEERLKWKDIIQAVEKLRYTLPTEQMAYNQVVALANPASMHAPATKSTPTTPNQTNSKAKPASQTAPQSVTHAVSQSAPQISPQVVLQAASQASQATQTAYPKHAQSSTQQQPEPARNQFDKLLDDIEKLARPDWYYLTKIKQSTLTEFWNFEKCKCIYVTVDYLSKIPSDTRDLTLKVARSNLKKMTRLRLLRGFKIKVLETLVENKLMHMMELDVFDPLMVAVITSNLGKKSSV